MLAPSPSAIAEAQLGKEPELTNVLVYLYGVVRRHVAFLTRSTGVEEDVVQEAMLQISKALPSFAGRASLRTWALCITTRTARRYIRRDAKHAVAKQALSDVAFEMDEVHREKLGRLMQHVALLPYKKREAFVLMEIMGLTAKEASDAVSTFEATMVSRTRHARAEILQCFERDQLAELHEAGLRLASEAQA